jgi:SET domain-containing protein
LTIDAGRGVFTRAPISKGTILDVSPVLLLSLEENRRHIEHTSLYHYTYNWPIAAGAVADTDDPGDPSAQVVQTQAVVFGLGSMFNHSRSHQNVVWSRDLQRQVVVYRALQDIEAGEELCISYGDRLWFNDAEQTSDCASEENENEVLGRIEIDFEARDSRANDQGH